MASGSSERFGGGGGPISSQPSSCGKLFHEIAAANASVFAGKDLTGHGVGAAGNSSAAAAFGNGRYELLRSVSGPTTKATTASPSEKSCYSELYFFFISVLAIYENICHTLPEPFPHSKLVTEFQRGQ